MPGIDFGTVRPGTTLYIPFNTYDSNDPQASVTISGLATTDIEVYKDGSTTQRASDSGYTLLDTDGIDFDTTTGVHGISIDLSDNTTAGFYASGSQYWVVIASITADAATLNPIVATFRIGYPDAALNTTIATLSTQTSFTLTSGPAEDDALNGWTMVAHDVASAVQFGSAVVLDYTGSTKTVTLTAGPTFTMAATDNVHFYPPVNVNWVQATAQTANDNGADINAILVDTNSLNDTKIPQTMNLTASGNIGIDWANVENPGTSVDLSATSTNLVDTATDVTNDVGITATALSQINAQCDLAISDAALATAANLATINTIVSGIQTDLDNGTDGLGALKTAIDTVFTTQMSESYAADGVAPTPAQAIFLIQQVLTEFAISGTTYSIKKLDGSTTAATLTLDDGTTPTSVTRAT